MMTADGFPTRLRRRREDLGLRQEDAAKLLGVGVRTIGRWESGDSTPGAEHLDAIEAHLGLALVPVPEAQAADILAQITAELESVRHFLARSAASDTITLRHRNGAVALVSIRVFEKEEEGPTTDLAAVVTSAALAAGWAEHLVP